MASHKSTRTKSKPERQNVRPLSIFVFFNKHFLVKKTDNIDFNIVTYLSLISCCRRRTKSFWLWLFLIMVSAMPLISSTTMLLAARSVMRAWQRELMMGCIISTCSINISFVGYLTIIFDNNSIILISQQCKHSTDQSSFKFYCCNIYLFICVKL